MSITPGSLLTAAAAVLFTAFACFAVGSEGRAAEVRIDISDGKTAVVKADLGDREGAERRSLAFLDEYAGIRGLAGRIRDLRVFSDDGQEMPSRNAGSGVYFADGAIASVSYLVDLSVLEDPALGAHVSWLGCGSGALMMQDLLPAEILDGTAPKVTFAAPEGLFVSAPPGLGESDLIRDPRSAVFTVLPHSARRYYASSAGIDFRVIVTGEWQVADARLVKMTSDLLNEYENLFGSGPAREVSVNILPIPCADVRDRWRAETRGSGVLILSSPSTYLNIAEQTAHEQLRHELLHLWIPNALTLEGDYAWFYEGFIFYRALITGARLGQIRFEDVLATLGRVRRNAARGEGWKPLTGTGAGRWGSESGTLYSRWVLAAFGTDVLLHSKTGKNIDDLLREVFEGGSRLSQPRNGEQFVLSAMSGEVALGDLVNESIAGGREPDWDRIFSHAGLESSEKGLVPVARPDRSQRAFLKRLGYNGRR